MASSSPATEPQPPLPAHLKDHAFDRAGCVMAAGEGALAARSRGAAAECAQDALELLRKGGSDEDVTTIEELLKDSLYYVTLWKERRKRDE